MTKKVNIWAFSYSFWGAMAWLSSIFMKLAVNINYTSNKLLFQYRLKQNDSIIWGPDAKL